MISDELSFWIQEQLKTKISCDFTHGYTKALKDLLITAHMMTCMQEEEGEEE